MHDAVVEAHEKPSVPRPVLDAATRMAMRRNSWSQALQGLMRAYTALLWNAYDGQDLEHNKARVRELADSLKHKLEEHCPSAAAGAGHRAINDWLEASHEEWHWEIVKEVLTRAWYQAEVKKAAAYDQVKQCQTVLSTLRHGSWTPPSAASCTA